MSHPPPPHPVTQRQISGEETEGGEWLSTPRLEALGKCGGAGVKGEEELVEYGEVESIRKSPPIFDKIFLIPSSLRCVGRRGHKVALIFIS